MMIKEFKLCFYRYLYCILASIQKKNVNVNARGCLYAKKASRLQPGQSGALINWNDFNFHLHKKFRPGMQGWKCHVVYCFEFSSV